jgi:hypothetical protein
MLNSSSLGSSFVFAASWASCSFTGAFVLLAGFFFAPAFPLFVVFTGSCLDLES